MTFENMRERLNVSKLTPAEADELRKAVETAEFPSEFKAWAFECIQTLELAI